MVGSGYRPPSLSLHVNVHERSISPASGSERGGHTPKHSPGTWEMDTENGELQVGAGEDDSTLFLLSQRSGSQLLVTLALGDPMLSSGSQGNLDTHGTDIQIEISVQSSGSSSAT